MYYLRPDLTVTGYLYRYLSDYIWLKFFSAQMRFPSSNVTIGVRPQHIFPLMGSPLIPVVLGHHFMDKNDQQTRLEEGRQRNYSQERCPKTSSSPLFR